MAKLFIEDTTLTAIGDAIRSKTGSSDLIAPLDMPTAIGSIEAGGGGDITSWDIDRQTSSVSWVPATSSGILDKYMDGKNFTVNITSNGGLQNLFAGSEAKDLSKVVINYSGYSQAFLIFNGSYVEQLPKLNLLDGCGKTTTNFRDMFKNAQKIQYIDSDFWQKIMSLKDGNGNLSCNYQLQSIFSGCRSLRQLPDMTVFDIIGQSQTGSSAQLYYGMCSNCHALDTIEHLPVIYFSKNITSNMFGSCFYYCYRLKDVIFATIDGVPYAMNWKGQTIDLSSYVGYAANAYDITDNYNSGLTTATQITDDATYQALKDNADSWTTDVAYSRYNHDSAVRTINSLPDTSDYLASAGGTNTIKFLGASGSATDGGAISNLTADEIAVATAKGWQVQIV